MTEKISCPVFYIVFRFYTLSDMDGNVFYVGLTRFPVEKRLLQHLNEARAYRGQNFVNGRKCLKIRSLDYRILMTVIETKWVAVKNVRAIPFQIRDLEKEFIQKYLESGHALLNSCVREKSNTLIEKDVEPVGFKLTSVKVI